MHIVCNMRFSNGCERRTEALIYSRAGMHLQERPRSGRHSGRWWEYLWRQGTSLLYAFCASSLFQQETCLTPKFREILRNSGNAVATIPGPVFTTKCHCSIVRIFEKQYLSELCAPQQKQILCEKFLQALILQIWVFGLQMQGEP